MLRDIDISGAVHRYAINVNLSPTEWKADYLYDDYVEDYDVARLCSNTLKNETEIRKVRLIKIE